MEREIEYQSDSTNAICPYCLACYQVETEAYNENGEEEVCAKCGHKYWRRTEFDVTHYCEPMENGEPVCFSVIDE